MARKLRSNCSGVGQTSGLPVHGVSDSVFIGPPEHRALEEGRKGLVWNVHMSTVRIVNGGVWPASSRGLSAGAAAIRGP